MHRLTNVYAVQAIGLTQSKESTHEILLRARRLQAQHKDYVAEALQRYLSNAELVRLSEL